MGNFLLLYFTFIRHVNGGILRRCRNAGSELWVNVHVLIALFAQSILRQLGDLVGLSRSCFGTERNIPAPFFLSSSRSDGFASL